jgi:ribonucleoside-diphosphate reductase alpha chain
VLQQGREHGFRNAQATVLAPTGTISFMMDCDTTGIEPDIALVKYKQLAGGGMLKIVNRTVPRALQNLGYTPEQVERIVDYVNKHDTIEGAPDLADSDLEVFDCAFKPANGMRSIPWQAHVSMMAAAQPFLSGAISKTVNMPADSTPLDIAEAYRWGWELNLKALAIYRDGSKQSQPLSTSSESDKAAKAEGRRPRRDRLPDTRRSVTHKFNVSGHEGYVTVGLYDDGRPGELFITMAKEGSTIGGLMDSFGTAISMSLQYGVPLEVLVNKFSHTRFEPMGYTTNPDVRIAKSLVDYIFRWMGLSFLPGYREATLGLPASGSKTEITTIAAPTDSSSVANGTKESSTKPKSNSEKTSNGSTTKLASNGSADLESEIGNNADLLDRAGVRMKGSVDGELPHDRNQQFARFQSDAPSCDNCGSITVRNGNCYLCYNCGNSMGCS